jgi:hypothetical protein
MTATYRNTIISFLFFWGIISCSTEKKEHINSFVNKSVILPVFDSINFVCSNTLINDYNQEELYTIVVYADSLSCVECDLNLLEWKQRIREVKKRSLTVSFKFIVNFNYFNELSQIIDRDKFEYPIFFDRNKTFTENNIFLEKINFIVFLLDTNNKIILIGNPATNPKIWDLYKKQILGKAERPEESTTTIEIDKTIFDFGNIKINTKNETVFSVKNTGNEPLIIQQISASCGCTTVEWDKKPIGSGQTTEIKIAMHPEEEGYFNKTITVYCNIKESPEKLIISGTANK